MTTKRRHTTVTLHPDSVEIIHRAGMKMMQRTGSMTSPSIGKVIDMLACLWAYLEQGDGEDRYFDLLDEYRAWPTGPIWMKSVNEVFAGEDPAA